MSCLWCHVTLHDIIGVIEGVGVGLKGGVSHGKFKLDNSWQILHKPVSKYSIYIPT